METYWPESNEVAEVETISLVDVLSRLGEPVDYLKMDCEASEYDILMGNDLSAFWFIGIELHNQLGRVKFEELFSFISRTHHSNQACNFRDDSHQEVLFVRR